MVRRFTASPATSPPPAENDSEKDITPLQSGRRPKPLPRIAHTGDNSFKPGRSVTVSMSASSVKDMFLANTELPPLPPAPVQSQSTAHYNSNPHPQRKDQTDFSRKFTGREQMEGGVVPVLPPHPSNNIVRSTESNLPGFVQTNPTQKSKNVDREEQLSRQQPSPTWTTARVRSVSVRPNNNNNNNLKLHTSSASQPNLTLTPVNSSPQKLNHKSVSWVTHLPSQSKRENNNININHSSSKGNQDLDEISEEDGN
jgi:hypothetical protein